LTAVIIAPQSSEHVRSTLDRLNLRTSRIFTEYPPDDEVIRYVQLTGPSVVFLSTEDPSRAIALALAVDRSGVGTQVVAINRVCDPQVLVEIMRVGVREFLPLPLEPVPLAEALGRITEIIQRKPLTLQSTDAVFSFLPAKPGEGASTVALNVSSAVARNSATRTLLADFDLNLGMVSFLLQITNGRSVLDAVEVADNLDDTVWNNLVTKREGLDVLCSGRLNPENTLDPSKVEEVLHFARRTYGTICLDLPGNMEPYSMELLRQSKEVFVVSTLEIPSLHSARAKIESLRQAGFEDRASVLVNRSERRSGFFHKEELENLLGTRVRFSFMNDPKRVSHAMTTAACVDPKSDLGRQFETFSRSLVSLASGAQAHAYEKPVKRRFVEYFAIVPSSNHGDSEKRR
jgi:pilus assembly protein CpaE